MREQEPHIVVDISETLAVKVQALRMYRSQEDAQELAALFEERTPAMESFHQAWPPVRDGWTASGFWG